MPQKVSVIIPYNIDRGWLRDAVNSVKAQSYPHIELIMSQSKNRVGYNLNRGIEKASGDFIKYLCDDDLLTSDSIADSLQAFAENPDAGFIHGRAINFWPDGKVAEYIPKYTLPTAHQMLINNEIHGGTLMYRREVFSKFGGFSENLWTGEEYELNLRIMAGGVQLAYCDAVLYRYRRHHLQKSLGNMSREYQARRKEAIQAIRDLHRDKIMALTTTTK